MQSKLSTQPIKGFRDFKPEDWAIQKYIFKVWTIVCESFGYTEYNGPVLEDIQIYAKSGDDVGTQGKELYSLQDRGERTLALRPEMTPTVGRMIAAYEKSYTKPIRWFSIAQFFRAENPQKGRGREFFQLNADIFGTESIYSDFEIISLAVEIMLKFKATEKMFVVKINNRKFADFYFEKIIKLSPELMAPVMRIIDARAKNSDGWFKSELDKLSLTPNQAEAVYRYLQISIANLKQYESESVGAREIVELFDLLNKTNLDRYCKLDTTIARGFDYYTGMVFEVFDLNPQNTRSLFGGGRYDDLLNLFKSDKMPAVGFALGDITTRIFLQSWDLLPGLSLQDNDCYYIPILSTELLSQVYTLASKLRSEGKSILTGVRIESISDSLKYANKIKAAKVILIGDQEAEMKQYKEKDMVTGVEKYFEF